MEDQTAIITENKVVEKYHGFDFSTLKDCEFKSDAGISCRSKASKDSPYCRWHKPKLPQIKLTEIETLTIPSAIKLVNKLILESETATELDENEVRSLGAFIKIITAGTDIAFKEQSLIDAQTKLNNVLKIIGGILQDEIKSAPLFERIINRICAVDLNETKESVKKRIKTVTPSAPVPPVVASVAPVVPAIVDVVPDSTNADTQPETDETILPVV